MGQEIPPREAKYLREEYTSHSENEKQTASHAVRTTFRNIIQGLRTHPNCDRSERE